MDQGGGEGWSDVSADHDGCFWRMQMSPNESRPSLSIHKEKVKI